MSVNFRAMFLSRHLFSLHFNFAIFENREINVSRKFHVIRLGLFSAEEEPEPVPLNTPLAYRANTANQHIASLEFVIFYFCPNVPREVKR